MPFFPSASFHQGARHERTQRVELSDDRWLELSLTFDGLGLNGQVAYFDPALASRGERKKSWRSLRPPISVRGRGCTHPAARRTLYAAFGRLLAAMTPSPAFAWTLFLRCSPARHRRLLRLPAHQLQPTDAVKLLDESVQTEADGAAWAKPSTRRCAWRRSLRTERCWTKGQSTCGKTATETDTCVASMTHSTGCSRLSGETRAANTARAAARAERVAPGGNRSLAMTEFWDQDLSANAFSTLAGQALRVHAVKEGYELTTDGPIEGHPQLVSAALVLNRRLQPVQGDPACPRRAAMCMSFALCKPSMNADLVPRFRMRSSIPRLIQERTIFTQWRSVRPICP